MNDADADQLMRNLVVARVARTIERVGRLTDVDMLATLPLLVCRNCAAPWPMGQVQCACGSLYAITKREQ